MTGADNIDDSAAPLIEHLKELRSRVLWSIGILAVACIVGYLIWKPVFHVLSLPMCDAMEDYGQTLR